MNAVHVPRTEIKLRDYQSECNNAVWVSWNHIQRPAVVLPTGAGKTVIFSALARNFIETWRPSTSAPWGRPYRVVILVHRDELADQTLAKLRALAPDLVVGKVKAGDDDVHADVMVCSVQTLARKTRMDRVLAAQEAYGRIGLVIVDECHHAAADSYTRILEELGCFTGQSPEGEDDWGPGTRCVGFTATLARGDGVGLGRVWEDVVFSRSVLWMVSKGYLVDPHGREIELKNLDLGSVKVSGGDYTAASLGQALENCEGPKLIARIVAENAADRRTIVFTPTVATAEATTEALREAGFAAGCVSGATPREDTFPGGVRVPGRLSIYEAFRTGEITAMVNCMVLTEGADFPMADCAVIARPTQSAPLFIQMVGRVLRPWPGKTDALVLDVAGTGGKISTLIDLDDTLNTPIRDGESLADAYVRQEEEADRVESHTGNTAFLLRHKELDLFTASSHVWLRTPAGVMFIYVSGGFIFLWPRADGTWTVGGAPERGMGTARWQVLHSGLTLGLATAWAETEAESYASFGVSRQASWRKKPASARLIGYARSLGVHPDTSGARRNIPQGEISDAVAQRLAARQFDTVIQRKGN